MVVLDRLSRHTIRVKAICATLAVSLVFTVFTAGCASNPLRSVDSYEVIKQRTADVPGLLYFDVSYYETSTDLYYYLEDSLGLRFYLFPERDHIFVAYEISTEDVYGNTLAPWSHDLQGLPLDTVLSYIKVSSINLGIPNDPVVHPPLDANCEYRGIPVYSGSTEYRVLNSDQADTEKNELYGFYDYPVDTRVIFSAYQFRLGDFRYSIEYQHAITLEDQAAGRSDVIKEQALREVERLADTVISQYQGG